MRNSLAIAAPRIFDGDRWHDDAVLIVENGQVGDIVPADQIPTNMQFERLADGFIAPGFVDLQVNGGGGVLFNNDPSLDGIRTICAAHVKFGTTSLLPTLITDTTAVRDAAIAATIQAAEQKVPGFAGLHLEGPHLSLERKGAHDPSLIRPMQDDDVSTLIAARKKLPALMTTVAPESVSPAQVRALADAGIEVSIGHTTATYEQACDLVGAGATLATHLFNAMSQITARDPGLVGATLNTGALNAGLIADGYHVHPKSMAMALRAKVGPGRIFLVSDAMSTVGTDVTEFVLNGRKIRRGNGKLTLEDGTLAGADLELATAVRVMHQKVGVELGEALRMASLYPAEAIGLSSAGRLKSGNPADFVWLGSALDATATWIGGQRV